MTLLGHVAGISDGRLALVADLEQSLRSGDDAFREFTRAVDDYVIRTGIDALASPDDGTLSTDGTVDTILDLDMRAAGIHSVIWATGYSLDFGWIKLPIFNKHGEPFQQRGVSNVPRIYFLGLKHQHTLKSSLLCGVGEDAAHLAEHFAKA